MSRKKKVNWIGEKLIEMLEELEKLDWLMSGLQIGLIEISDPIQHFKKTFEKMGQKIDEPDKFVPLLKKKGFDTKNSKEIAKFLRGEVVTKFPFMYRIWTVMLWSILENYVRNFLIEWIKQNPDAMRSESIQKIQIRLGEYEALLDDEKYEYVLEMIEFQSKSKLGLGIGRFEPILEQFGLSGKVDDETKKSILELQQVRHVLVHRNGIVDKRLAETCPWVVPEPGKTIFIDSEIYDMYFNAVMNYANKIAERAYKKMYDTQKKSENNILAT
jgi:hypothetical protein